MVVKMKIDNSINESYIKNIISPTKFGFFLKFVQYGPYGKNPILSFENYR